MRFQTPKRSTGSVVSLTPLIDCMFLLIIFIMIVARFEPDGGIDVNLPTARGGEAAPKVDRINLTVTADGKIFLEQEEVPPENLERRIIETRTAAGDPDGEEIVLVVYGDKDAHHGSIVEALDAAARAKQKKVTIRTKQ